MMSMLEDLLIHLKRKEVRMGIILFAIFILGILNLFLSLIIINTSILLLLGWGLLEVILALFTHSNYKN